MRKLRSILYIAAALAIVLCTVGVSRADVIYSNDFTGGQGDFTIVNVGSGAGWAFDTTCPSSVLAGHSSPDNLRWGTFGNCLNYGPGGLIHGEASTPSLDLSSATCSLSFNYLLQFQEGPTFDAASVEVSDGTVLASNTAGSGAPLQNNGIWNALTVPVGPGAGVTIDFIGDTPDLTLNTGAGFQVDDVSVDCPVSQTPATSGWGVFVLLMGISVAMTSALFRLRRRTEVRGL